MERVVKSNGEICGFLVFFSYRFVAYLVSALSVR